jgi:hypothetical protein
MVGSIFDVELVESALLAGKIDLYGGNAAFHD